MDSGFLERAVASAGKDAEPQECPWHFKARGRRQAAITARREDVDVDRRDH